MFKLSISNLVTFPVKGNISDENGKAMPFSFTLTAERAKADDIAQFVENLGKSATNDTQEFLASKITGWAGVQDTQGAEVSFSHQALRDVLNIVGLSGVILSAYVDACSAKGKEKN